MFLILITPHEKYNYLNQKQFWQHTCAISPEEKHQSLSRFVVQTHLATIVVLDDHSLEV